MKWTTKSPRALLYFAAFLVLSAINLTAGSAVTSTAAQAKQCIWNKAGFILRARWYNKQDVITYRDSSGRVALGIRQGARHVQLDEWPIGQGRCTRGANANKELTVVLSVVGGKIAVESAKIGATTGAAIVSGVAGAVACAGTLGTACPAAIAAGAVATGLIQVSVQGIPDAKEVFKVVTPSKKRWLDVWGTVWSPQTGPGGNI